MKAVSIELADGRAISLMPFASIAVREGQSVIEGQALGTLAAGGDVSTSATHLHMGYKQGPSYLDPMRSSARPPAPRMILGYPAWEGRAPRMQGPLQQKGRPVS